LLGYLPGQYASPIWPTIGALGQPQIPGLVPQIHGLVPQLPGFVPPAYAPGPFGLATGPTIGGWLGQSLLASHFGVPAGPFGRVLPFETGLATMAAPGFAPQIAGWLPQPQLAGLQLAGLMGRSVIPYQTAVPQMAYAGA
jgi:hypothetical protein